MRVDWTPVAHNDLVNLFQYLAERNFQAAVDHEERILVASTQLHDRPNLGHPGDWRDTRELIVTGTPYRVVYRVRAPVIELLRIIHGARQWPPEQATGNDLAEQ